MKTDMPEWLQKCLSCVHAYYRQDDADMIYCRCRNGNCNYKEETNAKQSNEDTIALNEECDTN
jgi:hypothetical protein